MNFAKFGSFGSLFTNAELVCIDHLIELIKKRLLGSGILFDLLVGDPKIVSFSDFV